MDIRSSLDGLKSLLGVSQAVNTSTPQVRHGQITEPGSFSADHATLSSVGNLASQTLTEDGVRMDKVAGVQAALHAGTYNVPASAVASKLVDSMLGGD